MGYVVGIDLGTTFSAAAVYRTEEGVAESVPLGTRTAAIPSVVFLAPDGSMLIGEAAQRRSISDPSSVVREFKRRIGDDTPIRLTTGPIAPETIAARFIAAIRDQVAEREGADPDAIMVSCPAEWGPHKREVIARALAAEGLDDVAFISEPEAAALGYAYPDRIPAGSIFGVYDLGGGTFDAAVMRSDGTGRFEQLGQSVGLEHLGGMDFDEAVLTHVVEASPLAAGLLASATAGDATIASVAVLRRECTEAKEALSADTEVTIPVLAADGHDSVRMTRSEFELRIAPAIAQTVAAISYAIESAGVTPEELAAVVLVGGSSRIPLVAQSLGAGLGIPVALDTDPKSIVSIGAALAAAPADARAAGLPVAGGAAAAAGTALATAGSAAAADGATAVGTVRPDRPAVGLTTQPEPRRRPLLTPAAVGAGILSVIAVVAAALTFGFSGDSSPDPAPTGGSAGSVEAAPPAVPAAGPTGVTKQQAPVVREVSAARAGTDATGRTGTSQTQPRTSAALVQPRSAAAQAPAAVTAAAGPTTTTTTTTAAPEPCVIRTETGPKPCGSTGGGGTTTSSPAPDPAGTPTG